MAAAGLQEEWLLTPPIHYLERSSRYLFDDALRRIGVERPPMAACTAPPPVAWKIVRKALRLTVLSAFAHAAARAGSGPALQAVFRKH
jgi:hypothetical protein